MSIESPVPLNPDVPLVATEPIGLPEGVLIRSKAEIEQFVEPPAISAVENLWDKNIGTISSSANASQGVFIDVDWSYLSDENRSIAKKLGLVEDTEIDPSSIHITIDFDESSTSQAISEALSSAVSVFEMQELKWAPVYTIEQIKKVYGYETEEELKPEDVDEFYFAPDGKFHLSEELYSKSLQPSNI